MAAAVRQILQSLEQKHRRDPSGPALAWGWTQQMGSRPHAIYQALKGSAPVRSQIKLIADTFDLGINSCRCRLVSISIRTLV